MQVYTELIAPTAVTHATSLPFLNAKSSNLVIAKTCLLQIFRLTTTSTTSKLVLVGENPLSGTVSSLQPVKLPNTKSGGQALLIAFKDAKLSLVEWDPDNHRISTISIHYYEGDDIPVAPFGPSLSESESILTVDPHARCAVLKFGAHNLAILPFRGEGEDIMEGVEDADGEPSSTLKRVQSSLRDGDAEVKETPYKSSFILVAPQLVRNTMHIVDLAFTHVTRVATMGILCAAIQPSLSLLDERKDILTYVVIDLQLEDQAHTFLQEVKDLPSDLWKVVTIPSPNLGSLLIGTNELVFVDKGGKASAVAVNEYAKLASNMVMVDQSDLQMKLEGCEVLVLDAKAGQLLLVLNDGSTAIVTVKATADTAPTVTPVKGDAREEVAPAAPSCMALLAGNRIFIGSEDGNSSLLSMSKPTPLLSRKRSHAQMLGQEVPGEDDEDADDMEDDDDDDDLYVTAPDGKQRASSANEEIVLDPSAYSFQTADYLPSLAPVNDICFGRSPATGPDNLEMMAAIGRGKTSSLAVMSREIVPNVMQEGEFADAVTAWSIYAHSDDDQLDIGEQHDKLFFCYDGRGTKIYDIQIDTTEGKVQSSQAKYVERSGTDFEVEGETLAIATIANGTRIMQCRRSEIRTYQSSDIGLVQIVPVEDDKSGDELRVVHVSVCDPYVFVLREDSTIQVLQVDGEGEVEPLDNSDEIKAQKWLSGCLYSGVLCPGETILCLLGADGGLHMFDLPNMQRWYHASQLSFLPAVLSAETVQRRTGGKETLTELLVADVGVEDAEQPYLIVRSAMDDLTLYEPWTAEGGDLKASLRFRKVVLDYIPKYDEAASSSDTDGRPAALKTMRVGRFSAVHIPGAAPSLILKEATSLPRVLGLRAKQVKALFPLHRPNAARGLGVLREGVLQECVLPHHLEIGSGWAVQRFAIGEPAEEVRHVTFHEERGVYVVATCREVDFYLPGEDGKHEQDSISLHPTVPQYTLHLLSASSHQIIHSYSMPYLETITSIKVLPLEISEHSHDIQTRIAVGTGAQRGEDNPAKGALSIFEVLDVVPHPDRPETGIKLNLVSREETRGAITAVESFPGGLVGTAQGQKLMIRGLKEDGSCLPVAFLDAQTYTVALKHLGNTGLWLAADAWKGLWFGGFTQEPYKLTTLGKGRTKMEIITAEFLPFEGQLFILVVDAEEGLVVLQYDPENPKTLGGMRLLKRSTFNLGQFVTGMHLVPSGLKPVEMQTMTNGDAEKEEAAPQLYHVLTTSLTGAIGLVTPVDEATYRRLGALQTHLTTVLEHAGGLNPRAYRSVEADGSAGRGVVDGSLVKRVWELGSARRADVLARAGSDAWGIRSDLEVVGGGGLGWL